MDKKRKEYHNEIKRKGYPELGERDEENVGIVSLVHINNVDDLQIVISWGWSALDLVVFVVVAPNALISITTVR
ncbi:hypothetical protein DSCW_52280 [Desulfosarcina widdelii]|uniref:Uncharacterized protein n=1 Tax=Desulfosarcina widdelii TaxID=947919 RepID=A0A5K7ZDK8_9BACT|nr:hypothetical protein [Desulfosarcina widdelii]BBO77811.1 hypothetical protein DSCW_52280 [Desulfosarcina widdelii]